MAKKLFLLMAALFTMPALMYAQSGCDAPTGLTSSSTSNSSTFFISWDGPSFSDYEIQYRPENSTSWLSTFVSNANYAVLTNLDTMKTYHAKVRRICSDNNYSSFSDEYTFMTLPCVNAIAAYDYFGPATSDYEQFGPVGFPGEQYSYTQYIIDSTYLSTLGSNEIGYFGFRITYIVGIVYLNSDIYFSNISENDLTPGWIFADTSHIFKKVMNEGSAGFFSLSDTGWHICQMDSTFTWDGSSNILVTVVTNNGTYQPSNPSFFDLPHFAAHYFPSDEPARMKGVGNSQTPYDNDYYISQNPSFPLQERPDVVLIACTPGCVSPTDLYVTNVDTQSVTLSWDGSAIGFELQYKMAGDTAWEAFVITDDNSFEFTDLADSTLYSFRIRSICTGDNNDTVYSGWIESSFTTLASPCSVPTGLTEIDITYNSTIIDWTETGTASQWNIHVWNNQYDTIYSTNTHPFTITSLTDNTTYNICINACCSAQKVSDNSDTLSIHTDLFCPTVTNLSVTNTTANTASITWNGNGIGFDIEYGDLHFSEGVNTQVVHSDINTYTITGLEPEHEYSASVRQECEPGVFSFYCAQVDFTTLAQGEGIETTGTPNIAIYPNPTSDAATISISGVTGTVEVSLVDLNGRIVKTEQLECSGDCTKQLQVNGLSQGTYLVQLKGEGVNLVRKLIVE